MGGSMHVIKISENNVQLVMQSVQFSEEKDYEFLNDLWEYVLFSKNVTRTLPMCKICSGKGTFEYEGLGGIKKVGNGEMYIPITEKEVYVVPDILFHYFYSHNAIPTSTFRNAVLHGHKPDTNQYRKIVREVYDSNGKYGILWKSIRCSYCGEIFEGSISFRISKHKGNVRMFRENFFSKILYGQRYVGVCLKCLHYSRV